MAITLRSFEPHDFAALHRLDQACFPPGISYSKTTLRYFLTLPSADCVIAEEGGRVVGFAVSEENPPLAHIITLDVAEKHRRQGVGTVLLETANDNEAAVAFWKRHGYRIEATLKRYYLGRIDAYEMRKILPGAPQATPAQKET